MPYAAREETTTVVATTTAVTNKLLNAYLVKGTTELLSAKTRFVKLIVVGFLQNISETRTIHLLV